MGSLPIKYIMLTKRKRFLLYISPQDLRKNFVAYCLTKRKNCGIIPQDPVGSFALYATPQDPAGRCVCSVVFGAGTGRATGLYNRDRTKYDLPHRILWPIHPVGKKTTYNQVVYILIFFT